MPIDPYGIQAETLAKLANVHLETARRWKRAGRIPRHQAPMIALRLLGDLGNVAEPWNGFKLDQERIWTPEGTYVTPGDIRAIPYRRQYTQDLERKLAEPQQYRLL